MTVPRTVAEVLDGHVTLEVECINRMYLNLYQPKLVYPGGVVGFFKGHREMPFASSALMDPITKDFVRRRLSRRLAVQSLPTAPRATCRLMRPRIQQKSPI